ncbi:MAG: hypothetical protein ACE37F_24265 [Nannocystaceae bacterium]|nr:hypothetical protein [bacterium]
MASDGPSKPLVPPPPTLSSKPGDAKGPAAKPGPAAMPDDDAWLELIEDEPTAPKDTAAGQPSAAEPAAPPEQTDLPAKDTRPPPPQIRFDTPPVSKARRGVLPAPKSEGKRVQPVHAKPRRDRAARPSAAGLPSGMVPPGAPEAAQREDTDVLIASAVAALTEGEESAHEVQPAAATASAEAPVPVPAPVTPPAADSESPPPSRRFALWIGLGAAAALVGVLLATRSGEADPEPVAPASVQARTDAHARARAPEGPRAERDGADPSQRQDGVDGEDHVEPEPEPVAAALDLGAPLMVPDVGGGALAAEDPIEVMDEADAEDSIDAETAPPVSEPGRRSKAKRRRKPKSAADEPSRPAPAAPTTRKPDADALLADARAALAAGRARKAYSLASKSRSAKRSSAALVVMAKAACRFGGEAQAKSAFNQLSVSARRGIRSECRTHGVRLGL